MPAPEPAPELPADVRRRLDAVFGEVLPDTTGDEREPGAPRPDPDAALLDDRPPHHDRD